MDLPPDHKLLDYIQHLSAYILGIFAVFGAGVHFWWTDRVLTRNKIDENMDKVTFEMKKIQEHNQAEHKQIIATMHEQHTETMNRMLDLHRND